MIAVCTVVHEMPKSRQLDLLHLFHLIISHKQAVPGEEDKTKTLVNRDIRIRKSLMRSWQTATIT